MGCQGALALEPEIVIACMNRGFNNMSHGEAAELAGIVKPKVAILCHCDMFPDHAADPQLFRAARGNGRGAGLADRKVRLRVHGERGAGLRRAARRSS